MLSTFKRTCNSKALTGILRRPLCSTEASYSKRSPHHHHHNAAGFHRYPPLFLCSPCGTALQDRFGIWVVSFPYGAIYLKYGTTACGTTSYTFQSHSHSQQWRTVLLTTPLPRFSGILSFTTSQCCQRILLCTQHSSGSPKHYATALFACNPIYSR